MKTKTESGTGLPTIIGIDIGKEVFHLVGFGADGKITFRRKIRRLGLKDAFERLAPCIVGMVEAGEMVLDQDTLEKPSSSAATTYRMNS